MATEEPLIPDMIRIREAAKVLKEYVQYTPVMTSSSLDSLYGLKFHFKCENFQKTGSFKIRGSMFAVDNLCKKSTTPPILVTNSSGNHGIAVSRCAQIRGLQAHIVMPDTNKYKQSVVRACGAEIHLCADSEQARNEMTQQVMKREGPTAFFLSSHNHPDIVAGQGTVGLEILEQVPHVDAIVVAVSGGGLTAGVCLAAKSIKPSVKIYAAEPEAADDCARSFAAKKRIPLQSIPVTIADGLKVSVGVLNWPILQENLTDVITVSEEEIISAMYLGWERLKIIIEPSAAAACAAAFKLKQLLG